MSLGEFLEGNPKIGQILPPVGKVEVADKKTQIWSIYTSVQSLIAKAQQSGATRPENLNSELKSKFPILSISDFIIEFIGDTYSKRVEYTSIQQNEALTKQGIILQEVTLVSADIYRLQDLIISIENYKPLPKILDGRFSPFKKTTDSKNLSQEFKIVNDRIGIITSETGQKVLNSLLEKLSQDVKVDICFADLAERLLQELKLSRQMIELPQNTSPMSELSQFLYDKLHIRNLKREEYTAHPEHRHHHISPGVLRKDHVIRHNHESRRPLPYLRNFLIYLGVTISATMVFDIVDLPVINEFKAVIWIAIIIYMAQYTKNNFSFSTVKPHTDRFSDSDEPEGT